MRCLKKDIAREMYRELPTTTGVASRLTVRRRILHQSVMRVGDSPLLPGSPTTPAPKREHPWWPCMAKRAGAWPRRR